MFAVQQHGNSFIPDALKQGLVLQASGQQAQQGWQGQHMLVRAGGQAVLQPAHQAPQQVALYQQHPQQVRVAQMPISTAQLQPQQQQQQFMLAPQQQQFAPQPVAGGANPSLGVVQDGNKQVVYVNVGGALRRGVVQNGAVYLLPEDAAALGGQQRPQVGAMQVGPHGGHTLSVQPQPQPQQPLMVQQVLSNGQLVPVSGALVAPRAAGVQLLPPQQLQVQQPQAPPPQLQARAMPTVTMGFSAEMQQHQPVLRMDMGATAAPQQRVVPANTMGGAANAHMMHQQAAVLQLPQVAARAGSGPLGAPGPACLASALPASGQMLGGNSVSASTASLMPRMPASSTAVPAQAQPAPAPAGSQPMTIAAALAALPSNATAGSASAPAATGNDLCSPVAPPGTPGMGSAAVSTIGAVISKLAAADAGGAGAAVISGPPVSSVMGVAAGTSPLTSQPGTPPRSNSVGNHSSSSSSSSGGSLAADSETEAKAGVMRMLARTFIETGIGLQQALSMIQPADADMLAAAFAAEAAAGPPAGAPVVGAAAGGLVNEPAPGGVAALGADNANMPRSNTSFGGGSVGGGQDSCSLGSWGFSLFSNVTSDVGSQQGGSSFGGNGGKAMGSSPACAADAATATMFANLHV